MSESPTNTLGIKDLHEVLEAVFEVRSSWFSFGLALGVDEPTLQSTSVACRDNPEACLREVLSVWLRNCLKPTWDDIVIALRSRIVSYKQIANNIICSKPCSEVTIDKDVMEEEATPSAESQLPSDPVNAEQLQTAFQRAAKYAPVINWLESNDKIGKQSDSIAGNQGTELQSRGVPESEPEVTIEEPSAHDVVLTDSSSATSVEKDETNSGKSKYLCSRSRILTVMPFFIVTFIVICFSGLIAFSTLAASYRITGVGAPTISTSNEDVYLTRYSTVARLVDSVQFNKPSKVDPTLVELYAVDCSRLSNKIVRRNGSFNQPNPRIITATNLDILYLVPNTTLNVSVNVPTTDSKLNEPNCNLIVVIFDDYTQYQLFIIRASLYYASWTQAYRTICFNDSFSENVYISQSTNYYITMFIRAGIRVDRVDWQIEGIVISFNYTDSTPGCSLQPYDTSTCSISVDIFSDQGASEVCFFGVAPAENDEELIQDTVVGYTPSDTRKIILIVLPMTISFLILITLMIVYLGVHAYY